jgi:hemerythrin-like domain-containing protein
MEATDILMEEHRIIERVLSALENQVQRMKTGSPVRTDFFLDAAAFIRKFVDGCHHRKEEESLFTAIVEGGLSNQTGPIAIILAEHEQGRVFTRALEKAARAVAGGQSAARDDMILNAQAFVALMRQHIRRENDFLFPLAARMIPPDQQAKLSAEFERIEHEEIGAGVHEKYHALAEALEKEAAG